MHLDMLCVIPHCLPVFILIQTTIVLRSNLLVKWDNTSGTRAGVHTKLHCIMYVCVTGIYNGPK